MRKYLWLEVLLGIVSFAVGAFAGLIFWTLISEYLRSAFDISLDASLSGLSGNGMVIVAVALNGSLGGLSLCLIVLRYFNSRAWVAIVAAVGGSALIMMSLESTRNVADMDGWPAGLTTFGVSTLWAGLLAVCGVWELVLCIRDSDR